MDVRVGGNRCTGTAADDSPDIAAIRCCFTFFLFFLLHFFNHSARKASGVEKHGKILHFLPPVKNRGRLVEMSIRIIRATHRL